MEAAPPQKTPTTPMDMFFKLLKVLFGLSISGGIGFIIYVVVYAIYCKFNGLKPPEWWPDWLTKLIYTPPPVYKFKQNVTPVKFTTSNVLTDTTASDCLTACTNTDSCIGIVINPSSNVCSLIKSLKSIIPFTGNNVYIVEGKQPNMYTKYSSNTIDQYTTSSLIAEFVNADGYLACASNCSSNTTCTGFVFKSDNNMCSPQTSMKSSNLLPTTALYTSYVLGKSNFIDIPDTITTPTPTPTP